MHVKFYADLLLFIIIIIYYFIYREMVQIVHANRKRNKIRNMLLLVQDININKHQRLTGAIFSEFCYFNEAKSHEPWLSLACI